MSLSVESIQLNDDCTTVILSFLPLHSVLSYGAASLLTLGSIDPFLASIRKNVVEDADLYRSVDALARATKNGRVSTGFGGESGGDIAELRRALLTYRRERNDDDDDNTTTAAGRQVDSLLSRQKEHLRFHKHCRRIISRITVLSLWTEDLADCCNTKGDLPLDRYVGCLITVACLLGRGIHGCPTESDWLRNVRHRLLPPRPRRNAVPGAPAAWMSLWILVHGTILRTRAPPEHHLRLLGMAEPADSRGGGGGLFRPASPDAVCKILAFVGTLPVFSCRDINFSVDEFGPLGPTFRGRDDRRLVVLKIQRAVELLRGPEEGVWPQDSGGVREEAELQLERLWSVQREVFKSRPMSVAPPQVYLSCHVEGRQLY